MFFPYPMMNSGSSTIRDLEELLNFMKKHDEETKHKQKEKDLGPKKRNYSFLEMFTLLIFASPFVGMGYSWLVIWLNKSYLLMLQEMVK